MSQLEVDKIIPQSGTTLTIGDSGDTISFADGATLAIDTNTLAIDSTNNRVGIGTTSPSTALHIQSSANENNRRLRIAYDGSYYYNLTQLGAGGLSFNAVGGLFHRWENNSSEVMRIDSSGNVGIGTSSPSSKLDVTGEIRTNDDIRFTSGARHKFVGGGSGNNLELGTYSSSNTVRNIGLVIDSGGNVGIGATSITTLGSNHTTLQINGTSIDKTGALRLRSSNDSVDSALWASTTSTYLATISNHPLQFRTNNTERMRITDGGNVLVGTTSTTGIPTGNSTNDGGYFSSSGALLVQQNSDSNIYLSKASGYSYNGFVRFFVTGIERGTITTNGSSVSYNTTSDYRLKENVVDLTSATERLKQLSPKRFNFIADADTTVDGFLAHEVQSVVPEAINGEKDGVDNDGNPKYQGIDQSKLVPLLVATIKELEARITALET